MPQHPMVIVDAESAAPDVQGGVPGGMPGGVPGGSLNGLLGSLAIPAPVPSIPPKAAVTPEAPTAPKQIRVGGDVEAASLIHEVKPEYPVVAKHARIEGEVRFKATIAIDGTVKDLHFISGHPLLVDAARAAVVQWVYRPTYLNGHPAEVLTDITVKFSLI
jgi:protein TonB